MANFDTGVKDFIVGEFTVKVNFPIDFKDRADVCCKRCPFLANNERLCYLTKNVVFYPNQLNWDCPLTFPDNN